MVAARRLRKLAAKERKDDQRDCHSPIGSTSVKIPPEYFEANQAEWNSHEYVWSKPQVVTEKAASKEAKDDAHGLIRKDILAVLWKAPTKMCQNETRCCHGRGKAWITIKSGRKQEVLNFTDPHILDCIMEIHT